MNKNLTLEQIKQQIRESIKKDNAVGIWLSFWRNVALLSD